MVSELRVQAGGGGEPTLLLLHGLGATSEVWDGWSAALNASWPGRWLAPDLPGHGGSACLPHYSFGGVAARVADLLATDGRTVVLGHSMGGVIGLALASGWFGGRIGAVVGVGIKVTWTEAELGRVRSLAERPVTWFDTRQEAADRYLRVSGLAGLLTAGSPAALAGVREEDGRWRLHQDPATFGVGAPDMAGLMSAARGSILLARGEHDPMVSHDQLADLDPAAVSLPGLGHNAHVEDPGAVIRLIEPYAG
jgi:pimeloyl-ACP methyl ester carboxylesterase